MKLALAFGGALLAMAAAIPAQAQITLTFDELNGAANESPLNYYNGGFGDQGTGPGPAYGITFSDNSITGCVDGNACDNTNASNAPSNPNILFFLSGGASVMNVLAGFDTGFSFFYSSPFNPGTVTVYDGLDGTGNVLATLNLPTTTQQGPGCTSNYCPFVPFGVTFDGTAFSVSFAGTDNNIGFDNITLGSDTPGGGTVPEPATWALMIGGFGMVGGAMRRRAAKVAYAA